MWRLLIALGWLYVAVMMALAQAFHPEGGVLSAVFVLLGYGVLPVVLILYVLGTPDRRRARRAREQAATLAAAAGAAAATAPDDAAAVAASGSPDGRRSAADPG